MPRRDRTEKTYYVYGLVDPRDGSIFYVGKGCGKRCRQHALDARKHRITNRKKHARITAIHDEGLEVGVSVIADGLCEIGAFAREAREISERLARGDVLANIQGVGGGRSRYERLLTEVTRRIMMMGTWLDYARMMLRWKGRLPTPEETSARQESRDWLMDMRADLQRRIGIL